MKTIRKFLLRILLWLPLIWVLLEGIAYIALQDVESELPIIEQDDLMPFDPQTLWKFQANTSFFDDTQVYTIDQHGMRTPLAHQEKESILFVGDSSAFGLGVADQDTLPEQTAACSGLRPLNAGVSGYSTLQIANQLPSLLETFKPHWVVLVVPWSDLMHASVSDTDRLKRAGFIIQIHQLMKTPLLRHSNIIRWFIHSAQQRMTSNPIRLDPNTVLKPQSKGTTRRVTANLHIENVKQIQHRIQNHNAQLIIVQLPINRQYPAPSSSVLETYRMPISSWSKRANIPIIDGDLLLQETILKDHSKWFVDAVHPSSYGHLQLAQKICTVLAQETLPSSSNPEKRYNTQGDEGNTKKP